MVINERENRRQRIEEAVGTILTAGRTAPKGKGIDNIEILALTGDSVKELAAALRAQSEVTGMKFFLRDAENLDASLAVILIGTRLQTMGLNCGYCGHPSCDDKLGHEGVPCTLNTIDVGIAIGSMSAMAADLRLDSRVMFSAGYSAHHMGLMLNCTTIFALPLSISSKSPFFDRVSTRP